MGGKRCGRRCWGEGQTSGLPPRTPTKGLCPLDPHQGQRPLEPFVLVGEWERADTDLDQRRPHLAGTPRPAILCRPRCSDEGRLLCDLTPNRILQLSAAEFRA